MGRTNSASRRIHILREDVARKIAAGEVIDRPYSVVRELLDNALDAGAGEIAVHLENGGLSGIRVIDDGRGMDAEDLSLSYLPHSTSKITDEDDLLRIASLGFRGEALASIAACARLEVISSPNNGEPHRLVVHNGERLALEPHRGGPGTTMQVSQLFHAFPARRRFLKRPSSETGACRGVFMEKSHPFPSVAFRLFTDGTMRQFLPAASLRERTVALYENVLPAELVHEAQEERDGFRVHVVSGRPEVSRRDRRYIQIFVNRRRIWEYALVQAVQYAYGEHLPGGSFPVAFVFLDVNPELVDFNVHPAKKEARFRDLPELHHRLVSVLKSSLGRFALHVGSEAPPFGARDRRHSPPNTAALFPSVGERRPPRRSERQAPPVDWPGPAAKPTEKGIPSEAQGERDFRYLGQSMNLFLLAELDESIYVVDQHATHERILYDRFRQATENSQPLLVPISVEVEPEEERRLSANVAAYRSLGIAVEQEEAGRWHITAMPEAWAGMEEELVRFITSQVGDPAELRDGLLAEMACKAAIKDGDPVDPATADSLLEAAFRLPQARCPHGRPLWYRVSRDELFQLLGRT
jgi:DNA mismatch repair protein MutL